ncbi:hypothetical protein KP626_06360 [Christensenella sp. MSJ-20]|nr:hypothetical protein KP626_06360 [Christensenella sp. MSJ-20]
MHQFVQWKIIHGLRHFQKNVDESDFERIAQEIHAIDQNEGWGWAE